MILNSPTISGSLTVTGNIIASGSITLSGSVASASFATSASNATNAISASYANNLTVAGTLTAQTLVVQTITSSVLYSSGSNVFGNNIANTQTFTGSMNLTGSLTVVTTGTELQVTSTGVNLGNALTDSHVISGSLRVNPNGLFVSSSGNVGIGVTPSVWTLGKAIEFANIGNAVWGVSATQFNVLQNAYYNAGYYYASSNAASYYQQASGVHTWYTAPSGTANAALTFTASMTILNNGNVGIGTSSPNYTLHIDSNTSTTRFQITNSTTGQGGAVGFQLLQIANDSILTNRSNGYMSFETIGTERMRIFSNGNVAIQDTFTDNGAKLCITSGAKAGMRIVTDATYLAISIGGTGKFSMDYPGVGSGRFLIDDSGYVYAPLLQSGAGTYAMKWTTSTGQFTKDTSSARYKDNIRDSVYGLSDIMKLRSAMFEYKNDKRTDIGLIAEEVNEIVPILAIKDEQGRPDAVSYDRFVSILIKAIQELKSQNDALQSRIETLESK